MDYASENSQVIATTHNHDIIEYAPIEKVLLIRDEQSDSSLIQLKDHEMVEKFKDVAPIHTLLKQDLLS